MKAKRGTAPKAGPKAGPENFSIISKVLNVAGFVGRIGPAFDREKSPPVYALLTDADAAFAELAAHFDRKGWGIVTRAEFDATLRADGIQAFSTRSPEATLRNRYQARHRAALSRAA